MAIDWFHRDRVQRERQSVRGRKKAKENYQECAVVPYLEVNHKLWVFIVLVHNDRRENLKQKEVPLLGIWLGCDCV